jgi:hypothetical protein
LIIQRVLQILVNEFPNFALVSPTFSERLFPDQNSAQPSIDQNFDRPPPKIACGFVPNFGAEGDSQADSPASPCVLSRCQAARAQPSLKAKMNGPDDL